MGFQSNKIVMYLQLALVLVLLASIVPQITARPSRDLEQQSQAKLLDHLLRIRLGEGGSIHHKRHHKRSSNYDDGFDVDYQRVQKCYDDEETNELCQRCSKVTKSSLVFPMCCSNEDETLTWCREYVYYGIQT
uniref:Putative secreted protein n=2 Tax=Anopheles triannulatus TaxID=58253 RepID=A0A2M4ATI7_9DIPT